MIYEYHGFFSCGMPPGHPNNWRLEKYPGLGFRRGHLAAPGRPFPPRPMEGHGWIENASEARHSGLFDLGIHFLQWPSVEKMLHVFPIEWVQSW